MNADDGMTRPFDLSEQEMMILSKAKRNSDPRHTRVMNTLIRLSAVFVWMAAVLFCVILYKLHVIVSLSRHVLGTVMLGDASNASGAGCESALWSHDVGVFGIGVLACLGTWHIWMGVRMIILIIVELPEKRREERLMMRMALSLGIRCPGQE